MADATYAIPSFHGGEISQFAQGRFDKPDYRTSLNVSVNGFPVEIGTWTRRPGTQYAGHVRGGNKGRVGEFDFEQSNPITMEFTDGWLRFRNGPSLLTTNDAQAIVSISSANPAVVKTSGTNNWAAGNTVIFPAPSAPLLENRQFTITPIDGTDFSLQDALTGANIDGSILGAIAAGAKVERVQELQTVFGAGSWAASTMRPVQAETTSILLNNAVPPQAVTVSAFPTLTANATFAIQPLTFNDGPYLDPFTNGVQVTPGAVSGIVTMTLSFPTFNSATAYPKNAFITASGVNYISLQDQNVGQTPASSPTFWKATLVGAAINNGAGLSGNDVGRLVRFFSEPALWAVGTTYGAGNIVAYNPSGLPGQETYWSSVAGSNTGNVPGADATHWSLLDVENAAVWTWGKITGLSNAISGSTGSNIGSMTGGGGLAGAFDGNLLKNNTASALQSIGGSGVNIDNGLSLSIDGYVGKNYSSGSQKIDHVVINPSIDAGFGVGAYTVFNSGFQLGSFTFSPIFVLNLRASNSAPASPSNGTLLGTSGTIVNTLSPITINSSDNSTLYEYVWVEIISTFSIPPEAGFGLKGLTATYGFSNSIGQVQIFNPTGTSSGASFNVEILGPALLYEALITTWRIGAYGGPNGYPTCGCWAEGRLWLGGAIPNRFDASVSNGISGATVNFAPTDQFGTVADNAAVDLTLNSNSVNPIRWMKSSLEGVIIGTQNGEVLVQAPTTGPISPSNIVARVMTKHGSADIEPVRTPHTLIIVKRYAQKLLELFADAFSGKYSAPNLADKAEHIVANGISEISFTEATTPILWGYDTLGSLFGVTYKRDTLTTSNPPDFYGWHRHVLGTGRIVESICSGASVGGDLDALTLVTNDPTTNIRHVEVLADIPNETTPFPNSWFLDDAVTPSSTSTTNVASAGAPYGGLTINGLWHLNGKTVQVFAGGLDCGDRGPGTDGFTDFVVVNGSITVPYGDSISSGPGQGLFTAAFVATNPPIVIGCTFTSQGQMVRPISPADTGARNGPALGKIRRIHRYAMLLSNTLGLSVGSSFGNLFPAIFKMADGNTPIDPLTTFSGVHQDTLQDDYSYDGMLAWQIDRPVPANVIAVSGNLAAQDQ